MFSWRLGPAGAGAKAGVASPGQERCRQHRRILASIPRAADMAKQDTLEPRGPMNRTLLTAALTAALATSAAAQTAGGRIDVVIQPEPPGLMLGLTQNGPTQMVAGNIYESLLRYDTELNPMPSLATEWEVSDDGLTYTFKLKEGVTWHDGEPFTADDVVFSVDEFLRETHPRLRAARARGSVTAPDDQLLSSAQETLRPSSALRGRHQPMIPEHINEGTDFQNNPENNTPIGTDTERSTSR